METWFDCKPTHASVPDEIIRAEEDAAWAWRKLDELIEERIPGLDHYEPEYWQEHERRYQAAIAAEKRLRDLRNGHLNGCTCDPDPNREGMTCPACKEALGHGEEIPF